MFLHIVRLNQCLMNDLGKLLGSTWKLDSNPIPASQNYSEKFSLETLSLKDLTKHAAIWLYFQIVISDEVFKSVNPAILHCTDDKVKLSYFHVKWLMQNSEVKNADNKGREFKKYRKEQLAKLVECCEMLFSIERTCRRSLKKEGVNEKGENDVKNDDNTEVQDSDYFDDILKSQVDIFAESVGKVSSYGTDFELKGELYSQEK